MSYDYADSEVDARVISDLRKRIAELEAALLAATPQPGAKDGAVGEALANLIAAAKLMPRATPKPGGASTLHDFQIEAAYVWGLDRACKDAEAALQGE